MRHKYIAKRYWKDISTPMGASDLLAKSYRDVIDLSLGDPDLVTDSAVVDKAFCDARGGHTRYTDFSGDPELKDAIISLYAEDYNYPLTPDEVFVCASGCHGMYLALEAVLDDGDEVIVHAPYFTPYPQQIQLARGVPVILDTFEAQKFQIDPERMEGLINERTRALILNTPNNPTGACFTPETLHAIADIAIRHDLIVIADDIYSALCYNAPFLPITTLEGMRERTITINSFSKNFVMTGWRIGNVIGPDYILKTIQAINENVMFTAPSISQRAALYAIRDRRRIQGVIVGEYKERVMKAASRIGCIPDMKVLPPESSFYLFINVKGTGLSSAVVADRILEEAHVLVLPGNAFGACGEGYVRIACTVPEERLMEAFDRIARMELFSGGKTARTSA